MSELLLLQKKGTQLETKLENNPLLVYLAGLAPTGRRSMAAKLKTIATILGQEDPRLVDWAKLRFEHVSALRSQLETNKYSPATINNFLSAIKGVMKATWHLSLITAEEYQKILAVKSVNVTGNVPLTITVTAFLLKSAQVVDGLLVIAEVRAAKLPPAKPFIAAITGLG